MVELSALGSSALDRRDVPECLRKAATHFSELRQCVGAAEITDDDLIAKKECLDARAADECGALSLKKIRDEAERQLDVEAARARIEAMAAPIVARRQKAAADEAVRLAKAKEASDQEKKRCIGTNAIQIVLALRVGRDVGVSAVKGCTYDVSGGIIENTTRNGWMIVRWGDSTVAAIKSRKRHADGSYLRTTAKASFAGFGTFDRVGGGSATIATFRLAE